PPLAEQQAIADTLAAFDTHIANLTELIAKKKAIRDGALDDLMSGRTKLKGFSGDWEVKKLGELGVVKMCRRIFQDQTRPVGQIPFYKIGTFGGEADAYITRELYEKYKRSYPYPNVGDVLLSAAGTIGRAVMFDGKDSYFQDSNIVWLDVDHDVICNKFLLYFYRSCHWHNIEGTPISRLYNSIILDTQINLPPLDEQQAIAETLSALDDEINALESERSKITQIRDGAMNDLLTGKVRLIHDTNSV
ncbi:MAG: restriction endonuclease subunit S, partial [Synergistaceae bacterium]|nr:restriction endonuclease subunit S [Synergistaceae bacterium]